MFLPRVIRQGPGQPAGALANYAAHGTLARRMLAQLGSTPTPAAVTALYRRLADGLAANRSFAASADECPERKASHKA